MSPGVLPTGATSGALNVEDKMRDQMNDLTKLIKLALIFGFLSMIGSAAMAASSHANAEALSAAAQRAQL